MPELWGRINKIGVTIRCFCRSGRKQAKHNRSFTSEICTVATTRSAGNSNSPATPSSSEKRGSSCVGFLNYGHTWDYIFANSCEHCSNNYRAYLSKTRKKRHGNRRCGVRIHPSHLGFLIYSCLCDLFPRVILLTINGKAEKVRKGKRCTIPQNLSEPFLAFTKSLAGLKKDLFFFPL